MSWSSPTSPRRKRTNQLKHLDAEDPRLQSTWSFLIRLLLDVLERDSSAPRVRRYQAEHWGRATGETLVAELMPLPNPSLSSWIYDKLPELISFATRESYEIRSKNQRIELFPHLLRANKPKFVVAYTSAKREDFKRIFAEVDVNWKAIAAEPGQALLGEWESIPVTIINSYAQRAGWMAPPELIHHLRGPQRKPKTVLRKRGSD